MSALLSLSLIALAGLGPEFGLQPLGPEVRAGGEVFAVAIASDGANFAVAWEDNRLGTGSSIWAARVSASTGALLDRRGILVSQRFGKFPRIAYGNGSYLIVWQQEERTQYRLLRTDGTWDAPSGSAAGPLALPFGLCPDVAGSSTGFVIGVRRDAVEGYWVSPAGVLDAAPITLSSGPAPYGTCVRVASDPSNPSQFLAGWADTLTLQSRLLTRGAPVTAAPLSLGSASSGLRLLDLSGVGGLGYVPTWSADGRIAQRTVLPDGSAPAPSQTQYEADAGVDEYVTAGGGRLSRVVTFGTYGLGGVFGAELNDAGPGAPVPLYADAYHVALGASGDTLLLAGTIEHRSLAARRFGRDFSGLDPDAGLINLASGQQRSPVAAQADDGTFLAVWNRVTPVETQLFGVRLDGTGHALEAPQQLSAPGVSPAEPSVVFFEGTWSVAWCDDSETCHVRPVSRGGFAGAEVQVPSVSDGWIGQDGQRLVLLGYRYSGASPDGIRVTFDTDGGHRDQVVTSHPEQEVHLRLAHGDGGTLLVWQGRRVSDAEVYASRLAADGTPLDVDGGLPVSGAAGTAFNPEVADDGQGGFVVTWQSYSSVYAARVVGSLVSAPLELVPGSSYYRQELPHLVSVPGGVLVVWADTLRGDLVARLVVPSGMGLDAGPELVVTPPSTFEHAPAVTGNTTALLFNYLQLDEPNGAMVARGRLLFGDGPGAPCSEAWRCQSGVCASGACVGGVDPPDASGGGMGGGSAGSGGSGGAGGNGGAGAGNGLPDGGSQSGRFSVGCGCAAVDGPWLLAALLALRRRRQRRCVS